VGSGVRQPPVVLPSDPGEQHRTPLHAPVGGMSYTCCTRVCMVPWFSAPQAEIWQLALQRSQTSPPAAVAQAADKESLLQLRAAGRWALHGCTVRHA
jgi:hypothetical protein